MDATVDWLDGLVVALVGSVWPATRLQACSWAPKVGLPAVPTGNGSSGLSPLPTVAGPPDRPGLWDLAWSFRRHQFIGIGLSLHHDDGHDVAHACRARWLSRWTALYDEPWPSAWLHEHPRGFFCQWQPNDKRISLYWHPARTILNRHVPGSVDVFVMHADRADQADRAEHEALASHPSTHPTPPARTSPPPRA